jgi:asparagine synthase (glutamine-hydrolysing)
MCGIAGIIRKEKPIEFEEIRRMTDAIAHRGPDGEGHWLRENVAIGHRRLAIIDLETGKQPMSNEDKTVWITYNGELYNYIELRVFLKKKGHLFKTNSDTEVIIHSYEQWRYECVNHFRGMFAFGIVDLKKQIVFLARDHFGIKPLVYYQDKHCFAFASEIQALRKVEGMKVNIDLRSIDQYLWLQYIPSPNSIFTKVKKLPAAHYMTITFEGNISEPHEYYHIRFNPKRFKSEKNWIEELDYILKDSISHHIIADVPYGAFLSGGVDSSAVVAYMAQILSNPVKTFSIGFDEKDYDETNYAEIAADKWETEHYVEIVKPNALEILPKIVQHYGEPFGDSSAIPTYYVCQMARKNVTMVLSGDGGDEVFGGYNSYKAWMNFLDQKPLSNLPEWKQFLYPFAQKIFPNKYVTPYKNRANLANWLKFINYIPTPVRHYLWKNQFKYLSESPLELFEKFYRRTRNFGDAQKVQYMDLKTYLPFDILTKVDIASMIHSLEVRTPLVDLNVIEFATTIPQFLNISKQSNNEYDGKLLLKKLMGKYYSKDFITREKRGFAVPIDKWFGEGGLLNGEIKSRLKNKNSRLSNYFEPEIIGQFIDDNSSSYIWLLLFLDEWLIQNN